MTVIIPQENKRDAAVDEVGEEGFSYCFIIASRFIEKE
jgi:hypothetical protein